MKNYVISGATAASGKVLAARLATDKNNKIILLSRGHSEELELLSKQENVKYFSGLDLVEFENKVEIIKEIDNFFNDEFNLVHLAGDFWWHLPLEKVPTAEAAQMMTSQFVTLYSVCRGLIPIMVAKGGGRILAIGDNAVDYAYPYMSVFSAAKSANNTFIKCIGHEFANRGIAANVLEISTLAGPQNLVRNPHIDYSHCMTLEEFADNVIHTLDFSKQVNCSIIKAYEYNHSFYNEGFFQRLSEKLGE